ncbi:hypothetical protein P8452_41409 [Trifolium repens]|nr:hypothetical protein P8452_41409 [Trifolium repens]
MPSSHCLSTAREIMNLHDQAVQDYSHIDNSNTLFILRDIDPTVQSYSLMTKTCFVEFDPMNPRAKLPACLTRDIDVGSGVLTLTWNGFCKIALPNENSEITMVLHYVPIFISIVYAT